MKKEIKIPKVAGLTGRFWPKIRPIIQQDMKWYLGFCKTDLTLSTWRGSQILSLDATMLAKYDRIYIYIYIYIYRERERERFMWRKIHCQWKSIRWGTKLRSKMKLGPCQKGSDYVDCSHKKDVLGMTLNYIWRWGPCSRELWSMEHPFLNVIVPGPLRPVIVEHVKVPSLCRVNLFRNYLYSIRILDSM